MSQIEIQASFEGEGAAQEAWRKLQALRAVEVNGLLDSGLLTATVDESVAERALHLISQIGGNANTTLNEQ
ncbi:hypothetical protein [Paenibacillus sp. LPE1-1-1.1]|uniref:hypothetical protein n=1 Tax=Paenibacillaceae TaxID=186822 RepID=UPI003432D7F7